jgi:hypothetical protein
MANLFSGVDGRVGAQGSTGTGVNDSLALFLKKFAGEVLTVFDEKNIMKPLHTMRTISKGKSAQFPIIGTANAGYYTPGSSILENVGPAGGGLNKFQQTEKVIHIDKVLMASTFIASIDELVSHFDVRAPYNHQLGEALANEFDKNVLKVAVKTGGKQGTLTGSEDHTDDFVPADSFIADQTKLGSVVYSKSSVTGSATAAAKTIANTAHARPAASTNAEGKLRSAPDAAFIRRAMFESARLLDEKDVPKSDRYAIVTPAMYYELVNNSSGSDVVSSSVINKDVGGEGSLAAGTVVRVAGITLLVSNHLPSSATLGSNDNNWTGATGNDYRANYSNLAGIVFQKGGFATLKLMDLSMESEYLIERQGNLFVAKYSMGHGSLRPESVVVWSDGIRPTIDANW